MAEGQELERARDAAVRLDRGVADQQGRGADAICPHVRAGQVMAGDGEPDQRRHRGAADQDAAALFGEAEQLAAPFDHLALDVDRAVIASAAIRVGRSGDQLGQHAARGAGAVHPAPKARMRVAGGVRQDQLARVAAGPLDALTLDRQGLASACLTAAGTGRHTGRSGTARR